MGGGGVLDCWTAAWGKKMLNFRIQESSGCCWCWCWCWRWFGLSVGAGCWSEASVGDGGKFGRTSLL